MKNRCKDCWEDIVDLAEGVQNQAAIDHLAGCAACRADYDVLRETFEALSADIFDAPNGLIDGAKRLMPARQWKTVLRVGTLPQLAVARGASEFQAVYQEASAQIRVRYEQEDGEWLVTGSIKSDETPQVFSLDKAYELDSNGRFLFTVRKLSDTGFEVAVGDRWLRVPAATEAFDDGPG